MQHHSLLWLPPPPPPPPPPLLLLLLLFLPASCHSAIAASALEARANATIGCDPHGHPCFLLGKLNPSSKSASLRRRVSQCCLGFSRARLLPFRCLRRPLCLWRTWSFALLFLCYVNGETTLALRRRSRDHTPAHCLVCHRASDTWARIAPRITVHSRVRMFTTAAPSCAHR